MIIRLKNCLFLLLFISVLSCGEKTSSVSRMLLGTAVTITIADRNSNASELFNAAFKEVEKVQSSFSLYNASSEISVINNNAYPGPVRISDDVFSLIKSSLEVSGKTGGAFDITWASSGKLWDFSAEGFTPPDDIKIKSILPLISYKNIRIVEGINTVSFLKKGTKIGLGGIAKGYAVRKAVSVLRKHGVKGAIVACAGDIQVIGDNSGRPWKAGIQDPRGNSVIATFAMKDGDAVSTSGDYERFRMINGRRYHHIIDPATGYPSESGLISVTVFSKDPVASDAYSTAFFVTGFEKAKAVLAEMNELSAVFVDSNQKIFASSNLKGRLQFREDKRVIFF